MTANGNREMFSDTTNYIRVDRDGASGFAMGSASQDYITRTHSKYNPYPGDKLVNIVLGGASARFEQMGARQIERSIPSVSIQPDCFGMPYGNWEHYPSWASIDKGSHVAVHPGNVQSRNILLATLAIDPQDTPDTFQTSPGGALGQFKLLQTSTILPLFADECLLRFQNGTSKQLNVTAAMARGGGVFEIEMPLGTSVIVRVDTAALGVKVFHADRVASQAQSQIKLVADKDGVALSAMRLTCEHFIQTKRMELY